MRRLASISVLPGASPEHWRDCDGCGETYARTAYPAGSSLCWDCSRRSAEQRYRESPEYRRSTLEAAGVPLRYRSPWDPAIHGEAVTAWPAGCWAIVLQGPAERGKTYAAVEMLWRGIRDGWPDGVEAWSQGGLYVQASQLASLAAEARASEIPGQGRILLIDDLGIGHPGGGWAMLSRVLLSRYAAIAATIITTSMTLPEIMRQDPSTGSRLKDGQWRQITGPPLRGKS